eukprot:SAG31_NODE_15464_length_754_cov_0.705344_1_plen_75_part_10
MHRSIGARWSAIADAQLGSADASAKRVQAEITEYLPRLLPVIWQSWLECSPGEPKERAMHAADMLLILQTLLYLF